MSVDFGNPLTRDQVDGPGDDPAQARSQLDAIIARLNNKLVNVTILTASDKTGNDSGIVSGTAGTDGNLVQWNADGDAVDGPDVLSDISSGSDMDVVSKGAVQGAGVAALVPLAQATASTDASIDFTGLDSTYDTYVIYAESFSPASSGGDLGLVVSDDGGSNFDTGSSDYDSAIFSKDTTNDPQSVTGGGGTNRLLLTANQNSVSNYKASGWVVIHTPHDTESNPKFSFQFVYGESSSNEIRGVWGAGRRNAAKSINSVRLNFQNGDISEGKFRLYGVKKS